MSTRARLLATAAALTLASGVAVPAQAQVDTGSLPGGSPACGGWTARTVAAGFGPLENLAVTPGGEVLLSENGLDPAAGALWSLGTDGARRRVAALTAPGGIVVEGGTALVATGNAALSGLLGRADGTLTRVDLDTGETRVEVSGLTMPNGLVAHPDGGYVVTRDVGFPDTPTRVHPDGRLTPFAPEVTSSDGTARDPRTGDLYISRVFAPTAEIVRVRPDGAVVARFPFPGPGPLVAPDDLDVAADGTVYAAQAAGSRVVRIDPATGAQCTVADSLGGASAVAVAGPDRLLATTFLGTVVELRHG